MESFVKDLHTFLGNEHLFITGDVNGIFFNAANQLVPLTALVSGTAKELLPGHQLIYASPIQGLNGLEQSEVRQLLSQLDARGGFGCTTSTDELGRLIFALASYKAEPTILLLNLCPQASSNTSHIDSGDEKSFLFHLYEALCVNTSRMHMVIIAPESRALPPFITSLVREIPTGKPGLDTRRMLIRQQSDRYCSLSEGEKEKLVKETDGLSLFDIIKMGLLAKRTGLADADQLMNVYLHRNETDPWISRRDGLKDLEEMLHANLLGQDMAISSIMAQMRHAACGLNDIVDAARKKKPRVSLCFAGPTGVGKTLAAKLIARFATGSERNLIRVDCNQHTNSHELSRLFGAPPGYVGHNEGGFLTEGLRKKPSSVVLFDEIDKAHPSLSDSVMTLLDEGIIIDSFGKEVDASASIIIVTCNTGTSFKLPDPERMGESIEVPLDEELDYTALKERCKNAFRLKNRREFVARFNDIVVFDFIRDSTAVQINKSLAAKAGKALKRRCDIDLIIDHAVFEHLVRNRDRSLGARYIENEFAKTILHYFARLHAELPVGKTVRFGVALGQIVATVH